MKIIIDRILKDEIICECEADCIKLPLSLFPEGIAEGDGGDYENGVVTMWDEDRQADEEQLAMLFKLMC